MAEGTWARNFKLHTGINSLHSAVTCDFKGTPQFYFGGCILKAFETLFWVEKGFDLILRQLINLKPTCVPN